MLEDSLLLEHVRWWRHPRSARLSNPGPLWASWLRNGPLVWPGIPVNIIVLFDLKIISLHTRKYGFNQVQRQSFKEFLEALQLQHPNVHFFFPSSGNEDIVLDNNKPGGFSFNGKVKIKILYCTDQQTSTVTCWEPTTPYGILGLPAISERYAVVHQRIEAVQLELALLVPAPTASLPSLLAACCHSSR